jgi:hypothetical protein
MNAEVRLRIGLETAIAKHAIAELLSAGFALGVNDGEEITISNSTDAEAVLKAMQTTDDDYLLAYRDGKQVGWVRFVYGNSGWDVIADYSMNLDPHLTKTNAFAEQIEEGEFVVNIMADAKPEVKQQ